jgi:hypothetical protein
VYVCLFFFMYSECVCVCVLEEQSRIHQGRSMMSGEPVCMYVCMYVCMRTVCVCVCLRHEAIVTRVEA